MLLRQWDGPFVGGFRGCAVALGQADGDGVFVVVALHVCRNVQLLLAVRVLRHTGGEGGRDGGEG